MTTFPSGAEDDARGYEDFAGMVAETSSQSTPAWPLPSRARPGSPNVIVMVMDDMGFSDIGPFGAEISTPNLDQMSDAGYRLTNYHTAPVCSPARAALLTGLNSHRAGYASVVHSDPGYPGHTFELADDVPTVAESFRAGGYATFMVGKWHLTKESLMHDGADKGSWPLQRGFDRYFGSMDGFTTLFHPHRLVRDNSPVVNDDPDDSYLTDVLTDEALSMIRALRANDPAKPFFLYFAHQAVHGPLQAKEEDIDSYRGMYDRGWDHIRDERFRRQVASGLFPTETQAAPRNTEPGGAVPAWDDLSEEQRERFVRYMQVYAAAIDSVDQNLGRLLDHLRRTGEYENTIIMFTSDNGASGEAGAEGTRSYFSQFVQESDLPERWNRDVERPTELIGGPRAHVHYPQGWAYASNTPFRLYKGHTFAGGIHAPLLVSWPQGLPRAADDDGVRSQFTHVTDLGLTALQLAGVEHLAQRHGSTAKEPDGTPFAGILRERDHESVHGEQYVEFGGRRAFFSGAWKIVTDHIPGEEYGDHEWELYDVEGDPTEIRDVAAEHPELVADLAEKWRRAAWHNTVFPLPDDMSMMTMRPSTELPLEDPVTLYPGTPTLERFRSSKLVRMRSFTIDVAVDAPLTDGVLVAHGDQGGGYVLFGEDGLLHLAYNEYGRMLRTELPVPDGAVSARLSFEAGPEIDWTLTLTCGDASTRLDSVLQLIGMSPFTGISVGVDRGSPVDWELYRRRGTFGYTGSGLAVTYTPGEKADYNHELIVDVERQADRLTD